MAVDWAKRFGQTEVVDLLESYRYAITTLQKQLKGNVEGKFAFCLLIEQFFAFYAFKSDLNRRIYLRLGVFQTHAFLKKKCVCIQCCSDYVCAKPKINIVRVV